MNLLSQRSRWSATLRGRVTDQSGALVSAAKVALIGSDGAARNIEADGSGIYSVTNVAPGKYTVQAFYLSGNFSGAVTRRDPKNQDRTWKIHQFQRISTDMPFLGLQPSVPTSICLSLYSGHQPTPDNVKLWRAEDESTINIVNKM
jgi:hypothetical protein